MPKFEVDLRGLGGERAGEELARRGIHAERLPGGILLAIIDADSAEQAEARIRESVDLRTGRVLVRPAGARAQKGTDAGAPSFDDEVQPGEGEARVEDRP